MRLTDWNKEYVANPTVHPTSVDFNKKGSIPRESVAAYRTISATRD
jgi:hypothetical protein